jgi:hypothetical protein
MYRGPVPVKGGTLGKNVKNFGTVELYIINGVELVGVFLQSC